MKLKHLLGGAAALLGALAVAALAQTTIPPISIPQVPSVQASDYFQDIQGGNPQAGNVYASVGQLATYFVSAAGLNGPGNLLIGGDGTTNLFQRGTTGASVTTTVTYGGPDRWAYWSGTGTAMTVSRDATAADLPATGFKYGFKMARTAAQTGVVQMCMAQEVESSIVYGLQNGVAEFDFHAIAGANMSAASNNLAAYVITGTGVDEGMSSLAFGLNAGGGGGAGWTGQASASAATIPLSTSTVNRYSVIAAIPAATTEIAVALCYTPVGTAGANDYVAFAGIELVRNNSLRPYASATGYQLVNGARNQINVTGFLRRPQGIENSLQLRYFWQVNEPAASLPVATAAGSYYTTTTCEVPFKFPVGMRVAPTVAFGGTALGATTFAIIAASATPTVLATTFLVQSTLAATNTVTDGRLKATTAASTAGFACMLVGAGGGANIQWSADL